ncbi:hypothetical protein D3C81_1180310 [compost metagenome]
MLATGPYADFTGVIGHAVFALKLAHDRRLELRGAIDIGVTGLSCINRSLCRCIDVVGCRKVGLSGRQTNHINTSAAQFSRLTCDRQRWRWFDRVQQMSQQLHEATLQLLLIAEGILTGLKQQ